MISVFQFGLRKNKRSGTTGLCDKSKLTLLGGGGSLNIYFVFPFYLNRQFTTR